MSGSLQSRLGAILSLAIAVAAAASGVFSFWSTYAGAHDFQDDELLQIATLASTQRIDRDARLPAFAETDPREDSQIIVQRLLARPVAPGARPQRAVLALPANLPDGLQTVRVDDENYRVAVRTTPDGDRIAVAQEEEIRQALARSAAWRAVLPWLILLPLLLVLVSRLIRRSFRPVEEIAQHLDRRAQHDFEPLDDSGMPRELGPFIGAINHLLDRVVRSVKTEQRFVANAAHELRSPMTALSLQAQRLDDLELPAVARERVDVLKQTVARVRHLLDQLLTLARVQVKPMQDSELVSVHAVFRQVLEDLVPLAEANLIDVGVVGDEDVQVRMDEIDLFAVVRNLADNAVRHTPPGGRVDLSVEPGPDGAEILVCDSGPGIPESERALVFDPFHRVRGTPAPGSGLGLAIVRAVAERAGAEVALSFRDEAHRRGLRVSFKLSKARVAP